MRSGWIKAHSDGWWLDVKSITGMNLDAPVSRDDVILLGVEECDMHAGREASTYSEMCKSANTPN